MFQVTNAVGEGNGHAFMGMLPKLLDLLLSGACIVLVRTIERMIAQKSCRTLSSVPDSQRHFKGLLTDTRTPKPTTLSDLGPYLSNLIPC